MREKTLFPSCPAAVHRASKMLLFITLQCLALTIMLAEGQQKRVITPGKTSWSPPTFPPTFRINATLDFPGWEITPSGTNMVSQQQQR